VIYANILANVKTKVYSTMSYDISPGPGFTDRAKIIIIIRLDHIPVTGFPI